MTLKGNGNQAAVMTVEKTRCLVILRLYLVLTVLSRMVQIKYLFRSWTDSVSSCLSYVSTSVSFTYVPSD